MYGDGFPRKGATMLISFILNVLVHRGDALATTLSALYGKLLVVMGIAFPMAEVISTYIPPSFYEVTTLSQFLTI